MSRVKHLAPFVALVLLGAVVGIVVGRGDDARSPEADVRAAAAEFAEVFNTYDYREADAHRDAVLELATGSFRAEYRDAFDQGLGQVIVEAEAVQTGFVKDVYVSAIDEERAQAIVTVDVTHRGVGGSRTIFDVYALLTFVEVDGRWKVDQVTDLNFDTAAGTSGVVPDGAAAPSTTVEVPASADAPVP